MRYSTWTLKSHRVREFTETPKSRMHSDVHCQHSMQQSWREEEEEAMLFVHIIRMARRSVHRKLRMSAAESLHAGIASITQAGQRKQLCILASGMLCDVCSCLALPVVAGPFRPFVEGAGFFTLCLKIWSPGFNVFMNSHAKQGTRTYETFSLCLHAVQCMNICTWFTS